jgi:hypothetical protein
VPAGWLTSILGGETASGDYVTVTRSQQAGRECLKITVIEDGQAEELSDTTFCRLYQSIPFPHNGLTADIMPTFNITTEDNAPRAGMIFVGGGHSLIVSFSDAVDGEQLFINEDSPSATLILPAELWQWSQQSIDLAYCWAQAGWSQPAEVDVSFFVSVHYSHPDTYELYVAEVAIE